MDMTNEVPDLSFLEDGERSKIIEVLNRDQQLRRKQAQKYLKLKQEIELIESKSIDIPSDHVQTATVCVRCRQAFGYFFNKGDFCKQCGFKICQKCRVNQVGSGFLFSSQHENKILWLCILCHKYNQYLVQTGDWIYNPNLDDSHLENFRQNNLAHGTINADPVARKKRPSVSSASSFVKSPLSGSQLITLSLCPNKKEEIINEIESVNFKKATLSKRYSTIKKARSQSILHEKKQPNNRNNSHSMEPQSLAKSNDQLTFEEKNQANILSDSLSPVNGKVMEQQFKAAPMAYGDDLESITSSEFDANSIFVTDSSRLVKHQNAESNDQTKSHEILKYNKKKDSSSNHSSLLDLANRNDKKNAESQALYQRDKSHTSLSAFRGTVDQDSEMNQMDQLFENFKNSKDTKRLETKPKFAYKRDLSKENAIHSVPSSPMPNSNRYREVPIDPVDEYLQLQLQQHEQTEPKPVNKIPKSNHMSLMRKPKNPFTNFERTISIKSINDHFSHDPNIKISGRICVKLSYEKKSSNLSVNIHSCDTLALIKKDCPNAYVKVYLKSNDNDKDKNMKRKTPVIKNNRSPIFDETLRYTISSSELDNHYLEISVWHKDKFGRNKYLGEVTVRLNSDVSDRASNQWYDLANRV